MEQTSNTIEHNMTDKIIEESVNHSENKVEEEAKQEEVANNIENTTYSEMNVGEDLKQEVVNNIENITNSEAHVEEGKQAKTNTKARPKAKPKTQHDTYTKLTKAEMKELADINNQFYTLLNRIDKAPNLKDELAKELLKYKKTHIKVNDEIINLKGSKYIVIEVI